MDGRFLLGYSHGTVLASAGLVHVWYGQEPTSDWAIVRIDKPLGREFGHLVPTSDDVKTMMPLEKTFRWVVGLFEWRKRILLILLPSLPPSLPPSPLV